MNPEDTFAHIKRGHEAGRLAHAYIVNAEPRRVGMPLAERIFSLLVCEGDTPPCGSCRCCRQVAAHTYPDVVWTEPQTKSRTISIGQIRDLQHRIQQTTFFGAWKGGVLVGADRLGAEASNAFLKTLEEPPGQALFLLLSDSPQSLLPTIVSRCQYLSVSDTAAVREEWTEEFLNLLAGKDDPSGAVAPGPTAVFGRTDQVVRLLKSLRKAAEEVEKALAEESEAEESGDILAARANARYREGRSLMMRLLMLWYRDQLLLVCGADLSTLYYEDRVDQLKTRSERLTYGRACRNVRIVEQMNRQLEMNLPETLVFSSGFTYLEG